MQTCNAYAYIQTPSHARTRTHAHAQTYTRAHMHTTHGTISKPPSLFLSQGDGESRCGQLYKYSLAHYVQFRDCGRMRPATAGGHVLRDCGRMCSATAGMKLGAHCHSDANVQHDHCGTSSRNHMCATSLRTAIRRATSASSPRTTQCSHTGRACTRDCGSRPTSDSRPRPATADDNCGTR